MALAGARLISRLRARGVRCSVCNHTQQVCVATQHTSTDIQLQTTHGGAAREPSGQVGSAQVNRFTRVRVVWGGGVGVCACVVSVSGGREASRFQIGCGGAGRITGASDERHSHGAALTRGVQLGA